MKKLVLGTALMALLGSSAAFACHDEQETAAKETKKEQPVAQKAEKKPAPVLLHHDLDLVQRILRDQLTGRPPDVAFNGINQIGLFVDRLLDVFRRNTTGGKLQRSILERARRQVV